MDSMAIPLIQHHGINGSHNDDGVTHQPAQEEGEARGEGSKDLPPSQAMDIDGTAMGRANNGVLAEIGLPTLLMPQLATTGCTC